VSQRAQINELPGTRTLSPDAGVAGARGRLIEPFPCRITASTLPAEANAAATPPRRRRGRLWSRLAPEGGIALPITMMVLTIGFALASVGSVAAISSLRNASRDSESSKAFAAAEAGIQQALLRRNKILTAEGYPCLVQGSGGDLIPGFASPNGWCPEQTGTVDGATFTYTVKPEVISGDMEGQREISIVSEGTSGEGTRRVYMDALASTGRPAFAEAEVVGLDSFVVSSGIIDASAGTNSDVNVNGTGYICGPSVTYGLGQGIVLSGGNAEVFPEAETGEQQLALSPPDPGDVHTNPASNETDRINTLDPGDAQWNPTTREMSLNAKRSLTLGGTNYSLCKLTMSGNSELIVAQDAIVRIYFDTPENCGYSGGTEQFSMTGNAEVTTTSGRPGDFGMLFEGSATIPTTVKLAGNGKANEVMIYAPRSDVKITGNGNYLGAIAGKTIDANGNGSITGHDSVLDFELGVQTAFTPQKFVECIGPLGSNPPDGC
jgi:hypothetical protein